MHENDKCGISRFKVTLELPGTFPSYHPHTYFQGWHIPTFLSLFLCLYVVIQGFAGFRFRYHLRARYNLPKTGVCVSCSNSITNPLVRMSNSVVSGPAQRELLHRFLTPTFYQTRPTLRYVGQRARASPRKWRHGGAIPCYSEAFLLILMLTLPWFITPRVAYLPRVCCLALLSCLPVNGLGRGFRR
ncbi:hypothetical protein F4678DRAFT_158360 [Xylaria arbuscula]|nr:hypothetical protein F4678DRAFT_158360 [Xylaria arbuscula]